MSDTLDSHTTAAGPDTNTNGTAPKSEQDCTADPAPPTQPAPGMKRKHSGADLLSECANTASTLTGTTPPPESAAQTYKRQRVDEPARVTVDAQSIKPIAHEEVDEVEQALKAALSLEENKTTLWIGDLERWEDEEYIYHFFNQMSPKSVVSVKVARDRDMQRSLGYGFIDFVSREVAEQILNSAPALKRPGGRRFKLTWARGKTRQPFNPLNTGPAVPGKMPPFSRGDVIIPPPSSRWVIEIAATTPMVIPQRIKEAVLRPLGVENAVQIEAMTDRQDPTLKVAFTNSNAFFTFISQWPDGCFEMCNTVVFYTVPPDVLERWTRMYEQSVEPVRTTQVNAGYGAQSAAGAAMYKTQPYALNYASRGRPYR